jgi:hypothetical protein
MASKSFATCLGCVQVKAELIVTVACFAGLISWVVSQCGRKIETISIELRSLHIVNVDVASSTNMVIMEAKKKSFIILLISESTKTRKRQGRDIRDVLLKKGFIPSKQQDQRRPARLEGTPLVL